MKKVLSFLMCAILALSLAACDSKSTYSKDDLSLHNTETDAVISIGMQKDEVIKVLGDSTESFMGIYNYSGLDVGYRDGAVALMSTRYDEKNLEQSKNFQTSKNITIDSSFDDFFKQYPSAARLNKSGYLYLYRDGDSYADISAEYQADSSPRFPEKYASKNIFVIALDSSDVDAKRPESLYVSDYNALMLMDLDR